MKKLLIPLLLLFCFAVKAQTSSVTLQIKAGNTVNYLPYTWSGKTGGFDTLWNAKQIRSYFGSFGSFINNSSSSQTARFNITGLSRIDSGLIIKKGDVVIGDTTSTVQRQIKTGLLLSGVPIHGIFGISKRFGGANYLGTNNTSDTAQLRVLYIPSQNHEPLYSDDGGIHGHKVVVADTIIGATLDTIGNVRALTITGGGSTLTFGTHLTAGGSSYDGSTPVTITSDATPSNTASTIVSRNSNGNTAINNLLNGFTTQNSNTGPFTLTAASTYQQVFTGGVNCTVTLPVASTLALGHSYMIVSQTSGVITVNSSGGNLVRSMSPLTTSIFTCVLNSGTSAASWVVAIYNKSDGNLVPVGAAYNVIFNNAGVFLDGSNNFAFQPTGGPSGTAFVEITGQLQVTKGITDGNNLGLYSPAGQQAILQSYHGIQLAGGTSSPYSPLTSVGTGADDYSVVIPIALNGAAGLAVLGKSGLTANYLEVTSNANKGTTHGDVFYITSSGDVNIGRSGTLAGKLFVNGGITPGAFTVSGLPTASSNTGMEAYVTDATTPAIGSTVVGGGSAKAKVWSNGTNWTVIGI